MLYVKVDWPRYEKAADAIASLKLNVVPDDMYWCQDPPCGFLSERLYELVKSYI